MNNEEILSSINKLASLLNDGRVSITTAKDGTITISPMPTNEIAHLDRIKCFNRCGAEIKPTPENFIDEEVDFIYIPDWTAAEILKEATDKWGVVGVVPKRLPMIYKWDNASLRWVKYLDYEREMAKKVGDYRRLCTAIKERISG